MMAHVFVFARCIAITSGAMIVLRTDNGAEFTAESIHQWLQRLGVKTLFIEPGSLWENGYRDGLSKGPLRGAIGCDSV